MFHRDYFPKQYFAPEYWPPVIDDEPEVTPPISTAHYVPVSNRPRQASTRPQGGNLRSDADKRALKAVGKAVGARERVNSAAQGVIDGSAREALENVAEIRRQDEIAQQDFARSLKAIIRASEERKAREYDNRLRLMLLMG